MSIHGALPSTRSPRATSPGTVGSTTDGTASPTPGGRPIAISARGLVKTYHAGIVGCSARVEAIRGATLDIESGHILGLLGPAGAGKSTLLLCLCGLLKPDAGTIEWFSRSSDVAGRPPGIVYVPERTAHYGFMTVREAVEYHALLRDGAQRATDQAVERALAGAGLRGCGSARIADLPWSAGGQLAIAQALLAAPRVLVLDETLSGVSPAARRDIAHTLRTLAADGAAVVVASDTFDVLDGLAPRVVVVLDGRVSEPVDTAGLWRPSVLELTVATPAAAGSPFDARVAEDVWDREVLRIPIDGTTPEAILARCRACGIRVDGSRVVPGIIAK